MPPFRSLILDAEPFRTPQPALIDTAQLVEQLCDSEEWELARQIARADDARRSRARGR